MPVTLQDVRAALDPDEPVYDEAARRLGAAALPFLRDLAQSADPMLASKAVSLAAAIGGPAAADALDRGAHHAAIAVRAAAAWGADRLPADRAEPILLALLDDPDPAVQKLAARSAGHVPRPAIKTKLTALSRSAKAAFVAAEAKDALQHLP